MAEKNVRCEIHGDSLPTYVCSHLITDSSGLGFNCDNPTADKPFPDAWCDDCEVIRAAHGEWNDETEKLVRISLLCSACYSRARIRNSHPDITLSDLQNLRWKCGNCEEWHAGPCFDFSCGAPEYWTDDHEEAQNESTYLTEDYCVIEDRDFFVRGIITLPIIGTNETFRWGVWGSLSRENFEKVRNMDKDVKRSELAPMFSWLSSQIQEYPETLNIKMYAHIKEPGVVPEFELERCDHTLAKEFHNGIAASRVKEIMLARLAED